MPSSPALPRRSLLAVAVSTLLLASCATVAPDPAAVLAGADQAMGTAGLKTLRFSASGTGATFGQAFRPDMPWPKLNYSSLVRVADYENAAYREDFARSRAEPNGGGAVPLMGTGEQRGNGLMQGGFAWSMAGPAPIPGPLGADARIHDLWTSPHGVLIAARRNAATSGTATVDGKRYVTLSFTEPGRFSAKAFISADTQLVERVESRLPHPVMGDVDTVTTYSDYRSHGNVKFPARIQQAQGGHPVLDVAVAEVQVNAPSGISVPDAVRNFAERVTSEQVAPGVWFLAGGSHNSVLIALKDHAVLVEAPLYDGRSSAVLAEARRLLAGKPIRHVINSHHHFDHAGGLRTAVAEGITVVTSDMARPWFEKTFANANRISPDLMARSGRSATVVGAGSLPVITDGERRIEIREIADSVHAQGFLMVYLPVEKLLIQADAYTPLPPNSPTPNPVNANNVNLLQNIERNRLAVDKILPLHGRVVALADLRSAVGQR